MPSGHVAEHIFAAFGSTKEISFSRPNQTPVGLDGLDGQEQLKGQLRIF
jgi:hypothetical protein